MTKKSQDAKFQLHIWGRLLEGRIALQKVVLAMREKDRNQIIVDDDEVRREASDENTIKSVTKLLSCMIRLRDTYRGKSQFCLLDNKQIDISEPEAYANIDDSFLDQRHDDYASVRNAIIEKWYEKTRIGTLPKKGYAALELPTSQLIANALKDSERLIKRTQLDRSSHQDDVYHPEIFNDDDFYHQLLKEVITKNESTKWVEWQRMRYKTKRKADTKATKGRKIKKDLMPKLVNFMAPSRPANASNNEVAEQIRTELKKTLFGGGIE